jgi:hypothetical protein
MDIYPLAVTADVATDICSSRASLRFASTTRIVVVCGIIVNCSERPTLRSC